MKKISVIQNVTTEDKYFMLDMKGNGRNIQKTKSACERGGPWKILRAHLAQFLETEGKKKKGKEWNVHHYVYVWCDIWIPSHKFIFYIQLNKYFNVMALNTQKDFFLSSSSSLLPVTHLLQLFSTSTDQDLTSIKE